MASARVERRATKSGGSRFCVRYRIGGRESALRFGGSFRTLREASYAATRSAATSRRFASLTCNSRSRPVVVRLLALVAFSARLAKPTWLNQAVNPCQACHESACGARPGAHLVTAQFPPDRLRAAIALACTAAGVPAFSPHDLRH
jgi:hypothetical protein